MSIITRIRASHVYQLFMRVLQFLSSSISLGLFTARLYRILQTVRRASRSNGVVEGILAAAVLYTLISMIMRFIMKKRSVPTIIRWLWIPLDLLFVAGFVIVAILTRPKGGTSGPCNARIRNSLPNGTNCNLPWGTFILAIFSAILHTLTAAFHEAKDHRRKYKAKSMGSDQSDFEKNGNHNGINHGSNNHSGNNYNDTNQNGINHSGINHNGNNQSGANYDDTNQTGINHSGVNHNGNIQRGTNYNDPDYNDTHQSGINHSRNNNHNINNNNHNNTNDYNNTDPISNNLSSKNYSRNNTNDYNNTNRLNSNNQNSSNNYNNNNNLNTPVVYDAVTRHY